MNLVPNLRNRRGFTFVELLIILAFVALLVGLLLPALVVQGRRKSPSIRCVNNLKNVGLAFRIFATDHGDQFPMSLSTNQGGALLEFERTGMVGYFQSFSNVLGSPKVLACPADTRKAAPDFARLQNENVSYFLGLDADEKRPQTLLAGDRNLTVNGLAVKSGVVGLAANTVVGWTDELHKRNGNVVLGDGSVQQFTARRFAEHLRTGDGATNRIVVP